MDARSERIQRQFDIPVLAAALLTIPVLVLEQSSFGEPWEAIGVALNWGTWIVFVVEIVVMLRVVPDRPSWIRENPLAIPVTVLTPPFLSVFGPARLLRLLRVLRLLRLAPAARRVFSMEGLRLAAVFAALTAVVAGLGFAALEKGQTAGEGIYWAITTMTTVGYGDLSPKTSGGRAIAVVVMLVGIGFVAILTGAVAQRFLTVGKAEAAEDVDRAETEIVGQLREIGARLERLEAAVRNIGEPSNP